MNDLSTIKKLVTNIVPEGHAVALPGGLHFCNLLRAGQPAAAAVVPGPDGLDWNNLDWLDDTDADLGIVDACPAELDALLRALVDAIADRAWFPLSTPADIED